MNIDISQVTKQILQALADGPDTTRTVTIGKLAKISISQTPTLRWMASVETFTPGKCHDLTIETDQAVKVVELVNLSLRRITDAAGTQAEHLNALEELAEEYRMAKIHIYASDGRTICTFSRMNGAWYFWTGWDSNSAAYPTRDQLHQALAGAIYMHDNAAMGITPPDWVLQDRLMAALDELDLSRLALNEATARRQLAEDNLQRVQAMLRMDK